MAQARNRLLFVSSMATFFMEVALLCSNLVFRSLSFGLPETGSSMTDAPPQVPVGSSSQTAAAPAADDAGPRWSLSDSKLMASIPGGGSAIQSRMDKLLAEVRQLPCARQPAWRGIVCALTHAFLLCVGGGTGWGSGQTDVSAV